MLSQPQEFLTIKLNRATELPSYPTPQLTDEQFEAANNEQNQYLPGIYFRGTNEMTCGESPRFLAKNGGIKANGASQSLTKDQLKEQHILDHIAHATVDSPFISLSSSPAIAMHFAAGRGNPDGYCYYLDIDSENTLVDPRSLKEDYNKSEAEYYALNEVPNEKIIAFCKYSKVMGITEICISTSIPEEKQKIILGTMLTGSPNPEMHDGAKIDAMLKDASISQPLAPAPIKKQAAVASNKPKSVASNKPKSTEKSPLLREAAQKKSSVQAEKQNTALKTELSDLINKIQNDNLGSKILSSEKLSILEAIESTIKTGKKATITQDQFDTLRKHRRTGFFSSFFNPEITSSESLVKKLKSAGLVEITSPNPDNSLQY